MPKFTLSAAIVLIAFAALPAFAQDDEETDTRPIAAVYEIQLEGISLSEKKIGALTDRFRDWITAEMHYRVVPGEATSRALVKVKAASHDPRCDTNCKIALGNALAAQKLIDARVDKVGGKCVVSATVYDVAAEISEVYGETQKPVDCSETGIRGGLREVAGKLVDPAALPVAAIRPDGPGIVKPVVTDTGRVVDMSEIDTGEDIVNIETGETGLLVIDSSPSGAFLTVNGRDEGVAKKNLQLPAGRYVVVARLDDFYHVARAEVTVEPNKVKRITMDLVPAFGSLDVTCTPDGAEVYVDGRFAGPCPLRNPRLRSGQHVVEARKGLYETVTMPVTIGDGEATATRLDLPAAWGKLEISSAPAGAQVWFDGRQVGITPLTTEMIPAGKYPVRLVMPLYQPAAFDVELGGGRTIQKNVPMAADHGSIVVTTTPPGASVVVDDGTARCESTPCTFPQLATGLHMLTIEKDGYGREVRNVDLRRGARETTSVTLREKMGSLTVFAEYADGTDCEGEIFIDGIRQPEPTPFMGKVLATTHVIEVICPGARPVIESVTVDHNKATTRTLGACVPSCGGRNCGSDGCGGDCGECTGRFECRDGWCLEARPAVPVYQASPPVTESANAAGGGSTSSPATATPSTSRSGSSDLQLTWETLGVGYLGSTSGLWHAITILPGEIGFKAFKGLLFSAFVDWQLIIPASGFDSGFLNSIHLGARLGYEFLNLSNNFFAMFVDAKLGWEYNFVLGDIDSGLDLFSGIGTHALVTGGSVGIRFSVIKLRVVVDYSTMNGLGAGFMISLGK